MTIQRKPLCKIDRVLLHLRQNARGLNVVEAVALGEYALRSSIATLRAEGWQIEGTWERIARQGTGTSRMIRYRLVGYQNPAETAEAFAALLGNRGGGVIGARYNPALTISPNRATFTSIGKRSRESRLPRKDETMKLTLPACRAATHANQIHTSYAGRSFGTQELTGEDRQGNGRIGLAGWGSALAQIHQPQPGHRAADERAHAVHDGSADGAGRRLVESHFGADAADRRDDRARQALTHAPFPENLTVFINCALRDAATAPTVYDALDVCADALVTLAALARMEGKRHVD
ncbi:helix-turn-helix domain-containing protein [Paraburkholderia sp. SIMBA_009]